MAIGYRKFKIGNEKEIKDDKPTLATQVLNIASQHTIFLYDNVGIYAAKNSLQAEMRPTEVVRQANVMARASTTIPKNPYRYFADADSMAPPLSSIPTSVTLVAPT